MRYGMFNEFEKLDKIRTSTDDGLQGLVDDLLGTTAKLVHSLVSKVLPNAAQARPEIRLNGTSHTASFFLGQPPVPNRPLVPVSYE